MNDSVVVALIMSGTSIACALIAAIASVWLLPSRRLAACEAELAAERAENTRLRARLSKIQGGSDEA